MAAKIVKSKDAAAQAFLKLGLYGKAGTGKTLTALLMAEKLAQRSGKPYLVFDSEDGTSFYRRPIPERKVHPAAFEFDLVLTRSITDILEVFENKEVIGGYAAVVIDSATHFWEACQNAYQGKRMSNGQIPAHAWGTLKRPWKRMMASFLDGNFHAILCGREGVVFEKDEEGDLEVTGTRMKAEGEAAHEPHVCGRMLQKREKDGSFIISCFFEKDRSGILSGKTFDWPGYETVTPLVNHLTGESQPKMGSLEESAEKDVEALSAAQEKKDQEQKALHALIEQQLLAARNLDELRAAWSLTTGKKTKLGDLWESLEQTKDTRKKAIVEAA